MKIKKDLVDKFAALITAAFGLVAALAWNSAIQEIFKKYYGADGGIAAMLTYAIIVTIIAVIATLWIGKIAERATPSKPAPVEIKNSTKKSKKR